MVQVQEYYMQSEVMSLAQSRESQIAEINDTSKTFIVKRMQGQKPIPK